MGNLGNGPGSKVQWSDQVVQHPVYQCNHLGIGPLECLGIAPRSQFTVHHGFGQALNLFVGGHRMFGGSDR